MAYLAQTGSGQPVLILKEGTSRSRGKEACRIWSKDLLTIFYEESFVTLSENGFSPKKGGV
jgi:hypothetical protein